MFFKLIDKFFDEIKKILSIVSFVLIALSVLLFVYWFLFAFKFSFPQWLNSFVWGVIDVFSWWYKPNKQHNEIIGILPFSSTVQKADELQKTVLEAFPESEMADCYKALSERILEVCKKEEVKEGGKGCD